MLTEIRIRDFAIIESVALPLAAGFNILSGETGAGKSIIVGALQLLLGERASSDVVRAGAEKAAVEGVFDVDGNEAVARWAEERGIDLDERTLILKREIAASGRGRAWANGTPVTAGNLAEVGRLLVSLHGQHEAQTLLDSESQRGILDAFADAEKVAGEVRAAFRSLADARARLADLTARRQEASRREDYLRHVAQEIEDASLIPGEEVRLEDESRVLEHAGELRELAAQLRDILAEDESGALAALGGAQRALSSIVRIDPGASAMQEQFDAGFYAIEELARAADAYASAIDLDPERLAAVRERRDMVFRLTRKYGPTIDDVIIAGEKARAELDLLDSGALDIGELEAVQRESAERLRDSAERLTKLRRQGSARLAKSVDALLPELGMPDGSFSVAFERLAEPLGTGAEEVTFHVTLNKGHPARALARVASGGELSRVMLALKTILARVDRVPTLVFDEVDAGIGGKVGLQVGALLRRVADHHQVFAVSHLPQLAARAHHHIVIAKGDRRGVTTADVAVVEGTSRVEEIARMLGGDPESRVSRAHAKELLESR